MMKGVLPGGGSAGSYGFDEEAPGDDGLKARGSSSPNPHRPVVRGCAARQRTKRADPCHRNGIQFALKIGFE